MDTREIIFFVKTGTLEAQKTQLSHIWRPPKPTFGGKTPQKMLKSGQKMVKMVKNVQKNRKMANNGVKIGHFPRKIGLKW